MTAPNIDTRHVILPLLGAMVGLNIVVQVGVAIDGSQISWTAGLLTLVVALVYAGYDWRRRIALTQIRFGRLITHLCAFVTVNLGFHAHAALLIARNDPVIRGDAHFPIDDQWFGVLFGMFVFWGFGLLIHLTASIASRGFENLHA